MSETHDESKRNKRTAKRILAIGLPLVLIASVGIGYAYWTAGGTGGGTATASGGTSDIQLTLGAQTPVSGLVPGGSVTLPVLAKNTNATTNEAVTTLAVTPGSLTSGDATPVTGCDAVSGASASVVTATGGPFVLAPGQTMTVGSVTISMPNSGTLQDSCKSKTFSVGLTSN